jgi:hypothetical protein
MLGTSTAGYRRPHCKREIMLFKNIYGGCFKISILNANDDLIHVCFVVLKSRVQKKLIFYFINSQAVATHSNPPLQR